MEARDWAQEHFWGCPLGDLRLQRRLLEVAGCIRQNPHGTLPQAIGEPMALKAAYRLLSNSKVTHEHILEPHISATREKCHEAGDYLLIEDTTLLSFTQRAPIKGMGPLTQETSQGLLAHTTLAAKIVRWDKNQEPELTLKGVFGQQCWARKPAEGTRAERQKKRRLQQRAGEAGAESDRWGKAVMEAGPPPEQTNWTLVTDREGDIFELLSRCAQQGVDWVIRASYPRNTNSEVGNIFETVAKAPLLGDFTLMLRSRPGVRARQAHLELRAVETQLAVPSNLPKGYSPQHTTLVEVRECEPPEDAPALHWVLLTSLPCRNFKQGRRVVGTYASRWLVEEYHKALKTGTHIEESQLSSADRIKALLAIHAVIASDLLQLKLLSNTHPDVSIEPDLLSPEALVVLGSLQTPPTGGWTNASALCAIARMGGYLARKHDGPPGWLSIWRGWQKLQRMTEGYLIALQQKTYG